MEPVRSASLARLFPDGVVVFALDGDVAPPLAADEAQAVARAVPSRQREFARGRACGRAALAALGRAVDSLPVGRDRAPRWPDGATGSITHCRGLTAAAAAPISLVRSLGLDAEPRGALEADVVARIAGEGELARAEARTGLVRDDVARLVFGAKEVVHKCVHPLTGVTLDFLDVELDFFDVRLGSSDVRLDSSDVRQGVDVGRGHGVDVADRRFTVIPRGERARGLALLARIEGRYDVVGAHLVAGGAIRA